MIYRLERTGLSVEVGVSATDETTVQLMMSAGGANAALELDPTAARDLARRLNRAADVAETYDPGAVSK